MSRSSLIFFIFPAIYILLIFFIHFSLVQAAGADTANLEEFAMWNINYGSLMIDEGKYLEAIEAYDTAFDASQRPKTKGKTLLQKAMVYSVYLDAPDDAIRTYKKLIQEYPEFKETAIYKLGLVLFDNSRFKEALEVLESYQKQYSQGRYAYHTEVLIKEVQQNALKLPEPVKPPVIVSIPRPLIRVRLSRRKSINTVVLKAPDLTISFNKSTKYFNDILKFSAKKESVLFKDRQVKGKVIISSSSPIKILLNSKMYKTVKGKIVLTAKSDKLIILNHVDIENYLKSVVPSESYSSWPLETLKAQAVCARTYALYQKNHRKNWSYDVVDTIYDQVYGGVQKERKKTTRAVNETQGVVVVAGSRHKPILSMFTANSGGFTADAKAIFNLTNKPYLRAKYDLSSIYGSRGHSSGNWTKRIKANEIEKILKKKKIYIGSLQNIRAVKNGPSGRVLRVKFTGSKGTVTVKSKPLLTGGGLKLPEVLVKIYKQGDTFIFKGKGFGHGVGYSQWGGKYMGENGKTYSEMLAFYYEGAELKKFW